MKQKSWLKLALILSAVGCGKAFKLKPKNSSKNKPTSSKKDELLSTLHYSWHKLDTYNSDEENKGIGYTQSTSYKEETPLSDTSESTEETTFFYDQSDRLIKVKSKLFKLAKDSKLKTKIFEHTGMFSEVVELLDGKNKLSPRAIKQFYQECEDIIKKYGDRPKFEIKLSLNPLQLIRRCFSKNKKDDSKDGVEDIDMFVWR
ncbi:hypothetical protein N9N67_04535 [Bacteriovoracaceae bacterium]|nr:hypothetical protein [Bacteriovoracaceae bacterium]